MNITIPSWLQDLFDETHPDCGSSQHDKAKAMREDLRKFYKEQKQTPLKVEQPALDLEPPRMTSEDPKDIANRIRLHAPAIDRTNLVSLAERIKGAIDAGRWDGVAERDLLEDLNRPFEGALNEYRVQNRRIKDFFTELLW